MDTGNHTFPLFTYRIDEILNIHSTNLINYDLHRISPIFKTSLASFVVGDHNSQLTREQSKVMLIILDIQCT